MVLGSSVDFAHNDTRTRRVVSRSQPLLHLMGRETQTSPRGAVGAVSGACDPHPFGSLATRGVPMTLRPRLATGLLLSRMERQFLGDLCGREKWSVLFSFSRASAEPLRHNS